MMAHGLKLQEYLKKGMPEANPATLLVQLKMNLTNQTPEKIKVLINTNLKASWIEILETIDRVYPIDETGVEGLIEDKTDKAEVNLANTNERGKNFNQSRGGMGNGSNGRANGGRFQGDCYRCRESGHRAFECPYGAAQNRDTNNIRNDNRGYGGGTNNASNSNNFGGGVSNSGNSSFRSSNGLSMRSNNNSGDNGSWRNQANQDDFGRSESNGQVPRQFRPSSGYGNGNGKGGDDEI